MLRATGLPVALFFDSRPVSRVLYPLRGVCHSSIQCVTTLLKRSTLRLGRATLKHRFTWTCSLQDTRPVHRCTAGGLLPHLLTLTLAGGYFLLRYSAFAGSFLLGSGALCAARTFLLCLFTATATDCPTVFYLPVFACKAGFCAAKVRQNRVINKCICEVLFYRFLVYENVLTLINVWILWYFVIFALYCGVKLIHNRLLHSYLNETLTGGL